MLTHGLNLIWIIFFFFSTIELNAIDNDLIFLNSIFFSFLFHFTRRIYGSPWLDTQQWYFEPELFMVKFEDTNAHATTRKAALVDVIFTKNNNNRHGRRRQAQTMRNFCEEEINFVRHGTSYYIFLIVIFLKLIMIVMYEKFNKCNKIISISKSQIIQHYFNPTLSICCRKFISMQIIIMSHYITEKGRVKGLIKY